MSKICTLSINRHLLSLFTISWHQFGWSMTCLTIPKGLIFKMWCCHEVLRVSNVTRCLNSKRVISEQIYMMLNVKTFDTSWSLQPGLPVMEWDIRCFQNVQIFTWEMNYNRHCSRKPCMEVYKTQFDSVRWRKVGNILEWLFGWRYSLDLPLS